jgi:hypothetical protein
MRKFVVLIFLFSLGLLSDAQQVLVYQKPDPSKIPVPVQLMRSVVNIETECNHGDAVVREEGTGFFIAYSDPRLPKDQNFQYLVTNRHVAQCWDEHNVPGTITGMVFRENLEDGSSRKVPVPWPLWRFPIDESVDLAALPILVNHDSLTILTPVETLVTKDFMYQNQISEGSRIMLAGYFYQFPGEKRFQSILREGIISMIPNEPMSTTTGKS